jgi:hypothetical protein
MRELQRGINANGEWPVWAVHVDLDEAKFDEIPQRRMTAVRPT